MSSTLQTVCNWTRTTDQGYFEDGSPGTFTRYRPGPMSVEYRVGENNQPRVQHLRFYTRHSNPSRRRQRALTIRIPANLRQLVAQLVRDNERTMNHFISAVILPDGGVIHV